MSVPTRTIPTGPRPTGPGERTSGMLRAALTVACGPALAGYAAVVAVLAALGWVAAGAETSLSATLTAAGAAWLAVHQVPLVVAGDPLGVLPLLPTALLVLLIARTARRTVRGTPIAAPAHAVRLLGVVAGVHATVGTSVAIAVSGTPSPVAVAPIEAAVGCGLVAAAAAACGLAGPVGWLDLATAPAPGWGRHALAAATLGLAVLITGALAAVLLGLVLSAGATREAFAAWGPEWGTGLGLTLLSVGYLPNAAVGALSWLAGPGLSVGALVTAPLGVAAGPVPAVPLLAALPDGPPASWWAVAFAVPVLAGVAVGRRCTAAADRENRLRAVMGAAGAVALACFVLALLAGGRLGSGVFDPVQVPAGTLAIAVALWTALPGAAVVWVTPVPEGLPVADDSEDSGDSEDVEDTGDGEDIDDAEDPEDPEDPDPLGATVEPAAQESDRAPGGHAA